MPFSRCCILLWGTNPQASQPVLPKQISHARRRGAKLIVIDPRQHALASKADCWLRVRPGSDGALALAMIHVLLDEGIYDDAFVRDWTNGPFLVREDTHALLKTSDLSETGAANAFVVWDRERNGPVVWHPEQGYAQENVLAELFGRFECRLGDGTIVVCRPVLDLLRKLAARFAPERSGDITWVSAADVRRAVRMFTNERPSAYTSWTGTEQHSSAMQMNRAIACFYALTGQFDQRGSNVSLLPTPTPPICCYRRAPPGNVRRGPAVLSWHGRGCGLEPAPEGRDPTVTQFTSRLGSYLRFGAALGPGRALFRGEY
jgi:anaerobic selenocysteine-containing dehydrogenase